MRSTTLLIIVFICMTTLYVTTAKDQCMCGCCRPRSSCQVKWLDPMFDIDPTCTKELCIAACPNKFQEQCGQDDSLVDGDCMPPHPSSASHIFNQYTILGALALATIAIFRI